MIILGIQLNSYLLTNKVFFDDNLTTEKLKEEEHKEKIKALKE